MKKKFGVFDYKGKMKPSLSIGFVPEQPILSGCIGDIGGGEDLLEFINNVIKNKNSRAEYWTNGYTVQVENKEDKKILKTFFRLTNEYEPCFIYPEEFKEVLEEWIREKEKFNKNPEEYKKELVKKGAKVINIEDYEGKDREYRKALEECENGVVIVKSQKEKEELEKLARKQ